MPYPIPLPTPPPIVQVESNPSIDFKPLISEPNPHLSPVVTLNTPDSPLPAPLQAAKKAELLATPDLASDRPRAATRAAQVESVTPPISEEVQNIPPKTQPTPNLEAPSTPPAQSIEIPVENAPRTIAPVSSRIVELNADRQE